MVKLGKEESPAPTQLNGLSPSPAPTAAQSFQSPAINTEIKAEPITVKAAAIDKSFMYSTKVSIYFWQRPAFREFQDPACSMPVIN